MALPSGTNVVRARFVPATPLCSLSRPDGRRWRVHRQFNMAVQVAGADEGSRSAMLQQRGARLTRFTGDGRRCSSITRNPSFGACVLMPTSATSRSVPVFFFDLFECRSVPAFDLPFRWDARSQKLGESDIGLERFTSAPSAVPIEISAAGLTTSDLSQ